MADAKEKEEAAAPAAEKPKSGAVGAILNVAGVFAASLTAVVAGGFINAKLHAPPEYVLNDKDGRISVYVPPPPKEKAGKEPKPDAPALFYSMDPPLVVNFEDDAAVRFLQVGVDLMTRDPKSVEEVQKQVPLIRNNLLLTISNRDYKKLMSRDGREELRGECLAEVRKILKKESPDSSIEDLLFTSFIVQ